MGYVFVSYSRSNTDYADRLVAHLEAAGLEVWIDRGDMEVGARYRRTIRDAIDGCDAFVLIMSHAAEDSHWVENELDWAERQKKAIFGLLLEGEPWFGLTTTHYEVVIGGTLPSDRFISGLLHINHPASATAEPALRVSQSEGGGSAPSRLTPHDESRTRAGHTDWVWSCAVAPDSSSLVSAAADKTLRLWDAATGDCLRVFSGHLGPVLGCALAADGSYLVSASRDRTLRLWDLDRSESALTLTGHTDAVAHCAVAPDGSYIVSASHDASLRLWDPRTGDTIQTLEGHTGPVWGCAVTADGSHIISTSADKTLRLWDPHTGSTVQTLEGHTASVWGCAVTAEGDHIISASADKTLRVWDTQTGNTIRTLEGHTAPVLGCTIAPDGRYIVSASADKTLRLWVSDPELGWPPEWASAAS